MNLTHPALRGCQTSQIGGSRSIRAGEHATFTASILIGDETDQKAGRIMAICRACTLFNFAVVTDEMLTAGIAISKVATTLAAAVDLAVQAKCQTIVFGIEIHQPKSSEWSPLRASLLAAIGAGSAVILPAGNRSRAQAATACFWPEVLVTASSDWCGNASAFSPQLGRSGNTIFAPGEDIPGAGPASEYVIRSGTSFAAAIAAGAFAIAKCLTPERSIFDIAADLCRPPHRILDGTALLPRTLHVLQREDHHATNNA